MRIVFTTQTVTHVDDVASSAASGVRVLAAWDVAPQVVDNHALARLTEEWFQRSHGNSYAHIQASMYS